MERDERALSRRSALIGGGALAALAGGGWYLFLREDDPTETAETFVERAAAGEFRDAEDLLHEDSPLDGAGSAVETLSAALGLPIGETIDAVPLTVESSTLVEEDGDEATVEVTVNVDLAVLDTDVDVPLSMRTENGDWRVWNIDV